MIIKSFLFCSFSKIIIAVVILVWHHWFRLPCNPMQSKWYQYCTWTFSTLLSVSVIQNLSLKWILNESAKTLEVCLAFCDPTHPPVSPGIFLNPTKCWSRISPFRYSDLMSHCCVSTAVHYDWMNIIMSDCIQCVFWRRGPDQDILRNEFCLSWQIK